MNAKLDKRRKWSVFFLISILVVIFLMPSALNCVRATGDYYSEPGLTTAHETCQITGPSNAPFFYDEYAGQVVAKVAYSVAYNSNGGYGGYLIYMPSIVVGVYPGSAQSPDSGTMWPMDVKITVSGTNPDGNLMNSNSQFLGLKYSSNPAGGGNIFSPNLAGMAGQLLNMIPDAGTSLSFLAYLIQNSPDTGYTYDANSQNGAYIDRPEAVAIAFLCSVDSNLFQPQPNLDPNMDYTLLISILR